jgi:DNA-directed RNA polymerase specialized sigma24 family protein
LIALYVHPPKSWEAVDSWVRTALVRKVIDESRRPWRRERSVDVLPETPWNHEDPGERMAVLDGLRGCRRGSAPSWFSASGMTCPCTTLPLPLGITEGTVKSHSARGLAALRLSLERAPS